MTRSFRLSSPSARTRRCRVPDPRWLVLSSLLGACGGSGGQTGDEHSSGSDVLEEVRGTAQRLATVGALPNSASDDGWAFGWKFYGEEASPERNVFFSPYSISVASA